MKKKPKRKLVEGAQRLQIRFTKTGKVKTRWRTIYGPWLTIERQALDDKLDSDVLREHISRSLDEPID